MLRNSTAQNIPDYGFSLSLISLYKDMIVDFVLIQENTGHRKPILWHILRIADHKLIKICVQ